MNERILEIAKQAGLRYPSEEALSPVEIKFAELIVQECVLISRTSTDGFSAGKRMEEQFGVDE
jgi:hypothetical protein